MARKKAVSPKRKKKVAAVQMKSEPEDVKAAEEPVDEEEEVDDPEVDKPETSETKVPEGVISTIRKVNKGGQDVWVQTCPYCSSECGDLVLHIKTHHKEMSYKGIRTKCPIEFCDKYPVDIKNHIRMVHDKIKNFPCNLCKNSFINGGRLADHIETVHKGIKSKCPHCNIVIKKSYMPQHIRKIHEGRKPRVACSVGCGKTYTSKADMDRHVLRVHLKYKVKCEFCDKCLGPEQMGRHVKRAHQGIFRFYCQVCQAGFDYDRSLRFHMNKAHTGTFVICQIPKLDEDGVCQKKLRTEEGVYEHIKHHVTKDYKVLCKECGSEVYSSYLEEHKKIHTKEKVKCDLVGCTAEFTNKDDKLNHVYDIHPAIMENFDWCNICKMPVFSLNTHMKNFHNECPWKSSEFAPMYGLCLGLMCLEDGCKFFAINQGALDRHTKSFHLKPILSQCAKCHKSFRNMKQHLQDFHSEELAHKCDVCEKGFESKKKLRQHMIVHRREKKMCELCSTEVVNLAQHIMMVHDNARAYNCEVEGCSTSFFTKMAQRKHMLHVHEGVKYLCEICNKQVVSLRSHIKIVHQKVRAHTCPECKKTFQSTTHLRLHIARVHLKVREKCGDCGKEVQDLYSHRLFVHQKQKNFPCDQCDTRCATSTALKTHIASVHLGERVKCPDCGLRMAVGFLNAHRRKACIESDKYAKNKCDFCNKRFMSLTRLERHVELKHENKEGVVTKDEP